MNQHEIDKSITITKHKKEFFIYLLKKNKNEIEVRWNLTIK